MFKFYFDGNEVSDPLNWEEFEENIVRDDIIKGLLPRYDIKPIFNAGGYAYLSSLLKTSGFCNLVALRVDFKCGDVYETVLNGYIPISDCKFNRNKCTVECQVVDDNYGARIHNNKSILTDLIAGKSKNGVDITPATEYDVYFFIPATGVYIPTTRKGILVYDALRYLIDFMTDGNVGFESEYLDYTLNTSLRNAKNMMLFLGEELRVPSQDKSVTISFTDLFKEIDKRYSIGFTIIKGSDGRPTVKIEEANYFYNATSSLTINDITDLQESFDNELLYSSVVFGGTTADYNAAIHSFGQVKFLGFKEEEYFLTGECNIDKKLELNTNYIVDSNIIEELIYTNTSNVDYDTNTFIVEVATPLASSISCVWGTDFITQSLPLYYNPNLTNNKVAERYNLQGSVAQYLGGNDVGFRASNTYAYYFANHTNGTSLTPVTQQISVVEVPFNNATTPPNYNTAGQYSTVTNRYTSTQDGQYMMGATYIVSSDTPSGDPLLLNRVWQIYIRFRRYNSVNTLLQEDVYQVINTTGGGIETRTGSASNLMFLANGDYVKMWITVNSIPKNYLLASNGQFYVQGSFYTNATVTGGGIYEESEPRDYFVSKLEFNRPLSYNEYKTLKLDLSKSLIVNHDGQTNSTAWIRKINRKFASGESSIQLISNLNNT